jgi:glycosyltransferase involved in cell wall biosynthesis
MNLTICIPTFNRPESLARVLLHLSLFKSPPEELVIGDNSGTSSALPVVEDFLSRFKSIVYLGRKENIGVMRNIDSIARIGTQPFVYVLSDDDFVYESALLTMLGILESSGNVVAVNGKYSGTPEGVVGLDTDLTGVTAAVVPKGGYELLWNHLEITDNLPLMRRSEFSRHAQYRDISCGVAPLIFDLLGHGDFVHLDAPVLQHEQRSDSISSRIATPEVTDMANGDLETVACKANLLGHEGGTVRGRVLSNVYLQGARVLFAQKKYLIGWHSLVRCNAYGGLREATRIWIEKHILPEVIMQRIVQIATDTGCNSIICREHGFAGEWVRRLNNLLKERQNQWEADGVPCRVLVLTSGVQDFSQALSEVTVPLSGLVAQYSLSGFPIAADASGVVLGINSASQTWTETDGVSEMQVLALRIPYAQ